MSLPTLRVVVLGEPDVGRHALVQTLLGVDIVTDDAASHRAASYSAVVLVGPQPVRVALALPSSATPTADALAELGDLTTAADALMLCFDASRPETFAAVTKWEDHVMDVRRTADSVRTTIVGTKSDVGVGVTSTQLQTAEHQPVIISSARRQRNVHTAFQVLLAPLCRALHNQTLRRQRGARTSAMHDIGSIDADDDVVVIASSTEPTNTSPMSTSPRNKTRFLRVFGAAKK